MPRSEDGSSDAATSMTRAEQKAATRERLLTAAAELFAEREFGEVTVADISARAGVAHGLLFHHFGSKQGLYRAVLDGVVAEMDSAFVAGVVDEPGDAIRAGLRAHLRYIAEHPALATRLIEGGRSQDADVRGASQAGRDRVLTALVENLGVAPDDVTVDLIGRTIVAAVDEASIRWVRSGCALAVDDMVTWLVEVGSAAVRAAAVLDPRLDVDAAVARLGGAPQHR
ncbi:TetR/AcrR family transcriptional regulator [Williamsia deligens]|uniref:TetR/AcrR family transcriptional regulator n=1 Tax=Williamsia deligens TaxID=321325 RepID=A0ABW3GFK6_9NOCA|nr:TetR/AcrR family transcriptional regulator [Williamsia deligens]MCP2196034.1 transcriptional regulator, TetR family [Williamsia deligens]